MNTPNSDFGPRAALEMAAHAVLALATNRDNIVKITVEPRAQHLGFIQFDSSRQTIPSQEEMELRIINCLAGIAAETGLPGFDISSQISNLSQAKNFFERLADSEEPTWRQTRPDLVQPILDNCRDLAKRLVGQHKAKII